MDSPPPLPPTSCDISDSENIDDNGCFSDGSIESRERSVPSEHDSSASLPQEVDNHFRKEQGESNDASAKGNLFKDIRHVNGHSIDESPEDSSFSTKDESRSDRNNITFQTSKEQRVSCSDINPSVMPSTIANELNSCDNAICGGAVGDEKLKTIETSIPIDDKVLVNGYRNSCSGSNDSLENKVNNDGLLQSLEHDDDDDDFRGFYVHTNSKLDCAHDSISSHAEITTEESDVNDFGNFSVHTDNNVDCVQDSIKTHAEIPTDDDNGFGDFSVHDSNYNSAEIPTEHDDDDEFGDFTDSSLSKNKPNTDINLANSNGDIEVCGDGDDNDFGDFAKSTGNVESTPDSMAARLNPSDSLDEKDCNQDSTKGEGLAEDHRDRFGEDINHDYSAQNKRDKPSSLDADVTCDSPTDDDTGPASPLRSRSPNSCADDTEPTGFDAGDDGLSGEAEYLEDDVPVDSNANRGTNSTAGTGRVNRRDSGSNDQCNNGHLTTSKYASCSSKEPREESTPDDRDTYRDDEEDFDDFSGFSAFSSSKQVCSTNEGSDANGDEDDNTGDGWASSFTSASVKLPGQVTAKEDVDGDDGWAAFATAKQSSAPTSATGIVNAKENVEDDFGEFGEFAEKDLKEKELASENDDNFGDFEDFTEAAPVVKAPPQIAEFQSDYLESGFPLSEGKSQQDLDKHIFEDHTICSTQCDLWNNVYNVEDAKSLKFTWAESRHLKILLASISVDPRNMLPSRQSTPGFTGDNVLLKPTPYSLMTPTPTPSLTTTSSSTMMTSKDTPTNQQSCDLTASNIMVDTSDNPNTQIPKSPIPDAEFNWTASGLTNPLDGCQKTREILDAFECSSSAGGVGVVEDTCGENDKEGGTKAKPSTAVARVPALDGLMADIAAASSASSAVPSDLVGVASTVSSSCTQNPRARSYLDKLRKLGFMKSKSLVFPLKES